MRICMVVYAFYESDTRVLQYTKALAERGDSVDVFALRREGAPSFEVMDGVAVYRVQSRKVNEQGRFAYMVRILRFLLTSAFVLTRKHLTKPYDVVHVHSVPDFLVFAALVPKLLGAHVVLDIHDILPEFYASKFSKSSDSLLFRLMLVVERLSSAFADHVIIANHIWQERMIGRSVRSQKCTTILNYPDPEIFSARDKQPDGEKFVILYPGTLNYHQGLDIAINAFALAVAEMPDAEFHIYGEGPARPSLVKLAEQLGVARRVFVQDSLPTPQIASFMASADLAVVPKRASSVFGNEAASTKIAEFMSLGVPVIVSRTKVDIFYHDDSRVMFFNSEDPRDLARCMLLLYRNPELRRELSTNGSIYVRQNRWSERKREYLSLIDNLCSPLPAAPRFGLRN